MHALRSLLLVALMAGPALAEPEISGSPAEVQKYLTAFADRVALTVSASHSYQAKRAVVHLVVATENARLKEALEENRRLRDGLVVRLAQAGIPETDVACASFSSTPVYGLWGKDPKNFKVENAVRVTIAKESQFSAVAQVTDENERIRYKAIVFDEADDEANETLLRQKLFQKMEAARLEHEKNLKVVLKPVRFNGIGVQQVQAAGAGDVSRAMRAGGESRISSSYTEEVPAADGASFGQKTLRASWTVEYQFVDGRP